MDAGVQQHDGEVTAGQNTRRHGVRDDETGAIIVFQREMNVSKEQVTIPKFKTEAEEAAQDLASQKGLPYQTYIKMVLHEALQKECRSA